MFDATPCASSQSVAESARCALAALEVIMRRSDGEAIEEALEEAPREALAMVRELLEEDDGDADLWAYLAECQTELEDREGALTSWAHYLTLDPHWPEAYTARCELFADAGDLHAARMELAVVAELVGDDARVLRTQALLAELSGDFNLADALYGKGEEADSLWPAPKRYKRNQAALYLQEEIDSARVDVEELPEVAEPGGMLRRAEVMADGGVTLYLRNLERDLVAESTLADLLDAALDALDALDLDGVN